MLYVAKFASVAHLAQLFFSLWINWLKQYETDMYVTIHFSIKKKKPQQELEQYDRNLFLAELNNAHY